MKIKERVVYRNLTMNFNRRVKYTLHTLLVGEMNNNGKIKFFDAHEEGIEILYRGNPFNLKTNEIKVLRDI